MVDQRLNYKMALARESIDLSCQWLLIRIGLKTVTIDERYELKKRTEFVQSAIARLKQ